MVVEDHFQTASFIWSVADLLRGNFKQSQYGRVALPFKLLRRMECVLEGSKTDVFTEVLASQQKGKDFARLILRLLAN